MTVTRFSDPEPQFVSANGLPLSAGTLTFYEPGTLVLKDTYPTQADAEAGSNPNTNPQVLNSFGSATSEIWLSGEYRAILKTPAGATIWDLDPVSGNPSAGSAASGQTTATIAALRLLTVPASNVSALVRGYYANGDGGGGMFFWDALSTASDDGGSVILPTGYLGTGRWKRLITDGVYNVKHFGAKGDNVQDDTTFIQATIDAVPADGGICWFPPGDYKTTAEILTKPNLMIRGSGKDGSVIRVGNANINGIRSANLVNASNAVDLSIQDIGLECTNAASTKGAIVEESGTFVDFTRVKIRGFKYGMILDQTELADIDLCIFEAQELAGIWVVNGGDWRGAAAGQFTNRLSFTRNQFNMDAGTYGILDDGGYTHEIINNNFNGGVNCMRLAGILGGAVAGNEFESATGACITVHATALSGGGVGSSLALGFRENVIIPQAGQNGISFTAAGQVTVHTNVFSSTVSALSGCANVALLAESGNIQAGAGGMRDNFGTTHSVVGNNEEAGIWKGIVSYPPGGLLVPVAGTTITPGATHQQFLLGGAVTMTAIPNIANGRSGQLLLLSNNGSFNLTLQDETSLAGSNVRGIGGADVVIPPRSVVGFIYSAEWADWLQLWPVS